MWCPNCGAYVASGDFCDRCGASLPASGGANSGAPSRRTRRNTFGRRPAKDGSERQERQEKRAGTLGDLFKSGSPFTGEQSVVQKPARSRGQTFLAWRDSHRGSADAATPPPARKAPRSGRQRPPSQVQPQMQPHTRSSPPSEFAPGDQPPFAADDPWNGTYDAPMYDAPPYEPRMNGGAPAQAAPQADPWAANRAANREWNVLPQSGPPSGPIAGSSSGWRARSPMVDLGDDENPEWMGMPRYDQYGQNGAPMPLRPSTLARYAAANLSRGVMNALIIGLIVVILAISIGVGLTHLASLTAQSTPAAQVIGTPVPTAPVPDGFTGYSAALFSLSYPSGWSHSTSDQVLSDGTTAHANSFTDGQGTTVSLYTTIGTANLLQTYLDDLAADTAVNAPLTPTASSTTRTYNRAKWLESDYTYSGIVNGKPAQMQMRLLAIVQGANAYFFVLMAPKSSFSQTNSVDFEPLLNSFRFY